MADSTVDWFVAPDAKNGDGSREKPFHDPWVALRAAGPGDSIHIAAGTYVGRYNRSSWIVDSPNLTIRGGYSRDFTTRTPWKTPSVFAADPTFEYVRENNLIAGRQDHSGLTLDGLFFDGAGRNDYDETKPVQGLRHYPSMDGAIASFNGKAVTIKNCVFANSATGGIQLSGDGSRFENNLAINLIGIGMLELRSAPGGQQQLLTAANNTFCFTHDTSGPPFGKGADNAIGIRVGCPAVIQNNVVMSCGNAGVSLSRDLERISLDGNLFYLTPFDILACRAQGTVADLKEKDLEELEDVGLKSAAGNVVGDPGMTGLNPQWFDAVSRHLLSNYATPPFEAANALRTKASLPALTPADLKDDATHGEFAPRISVADVLAVSFTAKQGFHPVDLPVALPPRAAEPAKTYKPIEWSAIRTPDPALANQRVELRVGLGQEQNSFLLPDLTPKTHMGIRIYEPYTDDGSIFVLAKRYTLVNRQFEEAIKANNGREVESAYFVRGIYHSDITPTSFQKVTIVVESIAPAPVVVKNQAPRPQGRDWFVKAGSSGGDGTQEKPFRDPFQALEKAEGGDAVHVAGGDYFGKLRSGQWKILIRNLTLLGGYNAEFTERDPWKNPTRFLLNEEEKAKNTRNGKMLDSEENSEGLILDGFIFDGATYNTYTPSGALDLKTSPTDTLVSLRGAQAPIIVRNCLFLNSATETVSISAPSGVFENNVLVNASGWSLKLNASGMGPWAVRNNTFLFAGDPSPRAGTGLSSPDGTLLVLGGRSATVVDSNIFAFGDNYGVRCNIAQQSVSFVNNVFAGNLHNHLTDAQYLWADGSTWDRCAVADSSFAAMTGNTLTLPTLPVDAGFADVALARLFSLPSRISTDLWKTLAALIGSSAKPPAAPAAPAPEPPKPAAATSLNDLMASLGALQGAAPKAEAASTAASTAAGPVYCPVYDWKKALALVQNPSVAGPGAHLQKLPVSFSAAQAHVNVQYTSVTFQQLDGDLAPWDNKPIELEISEARESSTNPAVFPAGTSRDDYNAYSVTPLDSPVRTRVSIVIRQDTTVSKVLGRTALSDKVHIRGIAKILYNPGGLAIIVDTAEIAQEAH